MVNVIEKDLVIIGGGPAGLACSNKRKACGVDDSRPLKEIIGRR